MYLIIIRQYRIIFHFIFYTSIGDNVDFCFHSFSFIKSMKELLMYNEHSKLNYLNGLKVITLVFILFGHRLMYLAANPMAYARTSEDVSYKIHWKRDN